MEKEEWLVTAVCGAGNSRELAIERNRAREGYEPTAAVAVRLVSEPGQPPYVVPEQGGRPGCFARVARLSPLLLCFTSLFNPSFFLVGGGGGLSIDMYWYHGYNISPIFSKLLPT